MIPKFRSVLSIMPDIGTFFDDTRSIVPSASLRGRVKATVIDEMSEAIHTHGILVTLVGSTRLQSR